jgi:aryl-alcohol dehydrogenase-like predicted oxidoreductase
MGKAIKKYNIPREKLVIMTKCYGIVDDDAYGPHLEDPALHKTREYVNKRGITTFTYFLF